VIIDAHCHVWPDHIAARALAGRVPGMEPIGDGTVAGARANMQRCGVDRSVVMGIADQARHVRRVNEWIGSVGSVSDGALIPFGTIHADLSPQENVDSLRAGGVRGIKLHPLFQGFNLDDERLYAILELVGAEFPVITHVGAGGSEEGNKRSNPQMLAKLVRTLPTLRLAACHFGGFHQLDAAEAEVVGLDVLLETSWPPTLAALDRERVAALIRKHGTDKVVFGSDWPMADPLAETDVIRGLGLTDDETADILGRNLARFLGGES
jgi:uncharacterized protein